MKYFVFNISLVCFFTCIFSVPVMAQQSRRFIQEKIYVHTDKDVYVSREILWFRIYYVNALNNEPESISKIAYAELLDKNNLPVVQEKLSLKPGEANGSMIIPVNISSGVYKFRAYTNWMKNFGPEAFFEKTIYITNPNNEFLDTAVSKSKRYDVQFFPEGGNLVQNIESRVGFRVTDAYGKGLEFEGLLLNGHGDTLVRFRPLHMGLGSFNFKPAANESYKTVIRFPQGELIEKNLPASFAGGYVMNLSKNTQGNISVKIKASADQDLKSSYLVISDSRTQIRSEKLHLTDDRKELIISPETLRPGISQITLYNKNDQAVCERLYFRYPGNKLTISADPHTDYSTRKKIEFNLSTADQSGKPVAADISLAVYRLDTLQHVDGNNIRNYLYLTSYIGPVESPEFYFMNDGADREGDMDNLMLTHGWRRFDWTTLQSQKNSVLFTPEFNGHIIQGKVTSVQTGAGVSGVKVYISVPSARTQFRPTTSDINGNFRVWMTDFYGSQELIVQLDPADGGKSTVEIANPFFGKYSAYKLPAYPFALNYVSPVLDQSVREQVRHIYSGNKMNRFSVQAMDTNSFYVVPDEKYMLDDYTRFLTMEEVIREYVHSSNVLTRQGKFDIRLLNYNEKKFFDQPPLILIDGVPFFDPNELFIQDPKKIMRLDLVNREYVLGFITFPGVVNVTTYNGDLGGIQMDPRATILDYPGIPEQREFFSPVYETEKQISSRTPDFRTLLYWSPELRTGPNGKNSIGFYSSDIPGRYAVVVQGLTSNGEPGDQVIYFEVKK